MSLQIGWRRTLADDEVRKALSAAFRRASVPHETAEALDWMETSVPRRWKTSDGLVEYEW